MVIEPYILIPSSALAVFVMVLFIRLVAGSRNAYLTKSSVTEFLSKEETGVKILHFLMSKDHKYALVELNDSTPFRLIRSFGDKLVMQSLSQEDLAEKNQIIRIPKQDIGHPAITFQCSEGKMPNSWVRGRTSLNDGEATR